jgi:hypothetical protein
MNNFAVMASACLLATMSITGVSAQDHAHHGHDVTPEMFAELREKIALYREYTDEEILGSMQRMGPNFHAYLSEQDVSDDVGVIALGHGFQPTGNEVFQDAFRQTGTGKPTAVGLGMAMMTSSHIQAAVDEVTAAGASKLVVIPATTVQTGGLLQQWQYIFGLRDDAAWMSVPRVDTEAEVVLTPTPMADPLMADILVDFALEMSSDPANEVVVLVSHGPEDHDSNLRELEILADHADRMQAASEFSEVRAFTLQDDAPSAVRGANIDRLRAFIGVSAAGGKRVIVLTNLLVKGSVHTKIVRDLKGMNYVFNQKGLMRHPRFSDWVSKVVNSQG